jgi:hypothetical protein
VLLAQLLLPSLGCNSVPTNAGTGVRADVIVYSSHDFEAERAVPNTLAYEVASGGVALYER